MKKANIVKTFRISLLILIFVIAIVMFGPQDQQDSLSYIRGSLLRVGLYPLVLALFRVISYNNEVLMRWFVIIFQNVVAIISIVLLAEWWIKNRKYKILSSFVTYFALLIPWLYELVDNLSYVDGYLSIQYTWITSTILTEGFTYSLLYLCVYQILMFSEDQRIKNIIWMAIYLLLLTFIRTQLLCLWPCVIITVLIISRKKYVIISLLLMFLSLMLYLPIKGLYMKVFDPQYMVTAYDVDTTTNIAFFMTEEDRSLMDEDELVIFNYIYNSLSDNKYLYEQIKKDNDIWNVNKYRSEYFTRCTYEYLNHIQEVGIEYFTNKYSITYEESIAKTIQVMNTVKKKLLISHIGEYLLFFIIRCFEGAMLTVLPNFSFSVYIFLVPYILYIISIAYEKNKWWSLWGGLIIFAAALNVCGIGLFVSHAHRYVLFFMGLIYLTIYDGILSENGILHSIIDKKINVIK